MSTIHESLTHLAVKRLICDCGGEMLSTGICLTTDPAQYPHMCNRCGKTENIFGVTYPSLEYVDIDPK